MNSRNYWFLAYSEYQWARYHYQRGAYEEFWARYTQMWRYLRLCIGAFARERYNAIRKYF